MRARFSAFGARAGPSKLGPYGISAGPPASSGWVGAELAPPWWFRAEQARPLRSEKVAVCRGFVISWPGVDIPTTAPTRSRTRHGSPAVGQQHRERRRVGDCAVDGPSNLTGHEAAGKDVD